MAIHVINMTTGPINSATNIAGFNHSVHNAISPGEFYVHDTLAGSYYNVRMRWSITDEDNFDQEIGGIVMTAITAPLAALGLVVAAAAFPPIVGAVLAEGATIASLSAVSTEIGLAVSGAAISVGGAATTGTALGMQLGSGNATSDTRLSNVPGAGDKYIIVRGDLDFKRTTENGKTTITMRNPADCPITAYSIERDVFEKLLADGVLSQAGMPMASDAAVARSVIQKPARFWHGFEIDTHRAYLLENDHPGYRPGYLTAHDGEENSDVYRVSNTEIMKRPESMWQFIRVENNGDLPIFAICERRFSRFLVQEGNPGTIRTRHPSKLFYDPDGKGDREVARVDVVGDGENSKAFFRLLTMPQQLGWTPFFEVIKSDKPGYFHLASAWNVGTHDSGERVFVSADEHDTTKMYAVQGHHKDSMDKWILKFAPT